MDKAVYIGFECSRCCKRILRIATKVFDCKVKAFSWKEDFPTDQFEWREYEEFKVEP